MHTSTDCPLPTYSLRAAKARLAQLVNRAAKGEAFVITGAGVPLVTVAAYAPARPPRRFGALKGKGWMADDFDRVDVGF